MSASIRGWDVAAAGEQIAPVIAWSDEDLVARAIADSRHFADLYLRYVKPVYRFCYRRLGNREAAEDLTQLIFEKAFAALPRFRNDGSFHAWLFTIAYHAISDYRRTSRSSQPIEAASQVSDPAPSPEEIAVSSDEGRQMRELLATLNEEQRSLIELRLAGLNDMEIAKLLGKSHGSVRTMQYRTVLKLRSLMGIDIASEENHDVPA
jgi:RNA polymerase sigma-70 factor (ECF subfamily)